MKNPPTPEEIERDLAFAMDIAEEAGERVVKLRATGRWEGKTKADIGDQAADGYLQGSPRPKGGKKQISDHLPVWAEFQTNKLSQELDQIINRGH